MHLLRGLGAAALIAGAIAVGASHLWLVLLLLLGALLLLRGCPMCWLMGLVETILNRRPGLGPQG